MTKLIHDSCDSRNFFIFLIHPKNHRDSPTPPSRCDFIILRDLFDFFDFLIQRKNPLRTDPTLEPTVIHDFLAYMASFTHRSA